MSHGSAVHPLLWAGGAAAAAAAAVHCVCSRRAPAAPDPRAAEAGRTREVPAPGPPAAESPRGPSPDQAAGGSPPGVPPGPVESADAPSPRRQAAASPGPPAAPGDPRVLAGSPRPGGAAAAVPPPAGRAPTPSPPGSPSESRGAGPTADGGARTEPRPDRVVPDREVVQVVPDREVVQVVPDREVVQVVQVVRDPAVPSVNDSGAEPPATPGGAVLMTPEAFTPLGGDAVRDPTALTFYTVDSAPTPPRAGQSPREVPAQPPGADDIGELSRRLRAALSALQAAAGGPPHPAALKIAVSAAIDAGNALSDDWPPEEADEVIDLLCELHPAIDAAKAAVARANAERDREVDAPAAASELPSMEEVLARSRAGAASAAESAPLDLTPPPGTSEGLTALCGRLQQSPPTCAEELAACYQQLVANASDGELSKADDAAVQKCMQALMTRKQELVAEAMRDADAAAASAVPADP